MKTKQPNGGDLGNHLITARKETQINERCASLQDLFIPLPRSVGLFTRHAVAPWAPRGTRGRPYSTRLLWGQLLLMRSLSAGNVDALWLLDWESLLGSDTYVRSCIIKTVTAPPSVPEYISVIKVCLSAESHRCCFETKYGNLKGSRTECVWNLNICYTNIWIYYISALFWSLTAFGNPKMYHSNSDFSYTAHRGSNSIL